MDTQARNKYKCNAHTFVCTNVIYMHSQVKQRGHKNELAIQREHYAAQVGISKPRASMSMMQRQ